MARFLYDSKLLFIKSLNIQNLRNIPLLSLNAHPESNFFYGQNGAGKTSILESIVVLSRGRSFRTGEVNELTGPNERGFRIFSEFESDDGSVHKIGLERSGKTWRARHNGTDVSRISQLTRILPLVLLEPESHRLVSGPPDLRRKYLDWGMFHVEHRFIEAWRTYARALKQRNAALRRRQKDVVFSLDPMLAELGETLDQFRKTQVNRLKNTLEAVVGRVSGRLAHISLEYQQGWSGESLEESLAAGYDRDTERGATGSGPHRAELLIKVDDVLAKNRLSRGEQKVLSSALLMAQASVVTESGERPLILLDDLASEFDDEHSERVLLVAKELAGQIWVTGVQKPDKPGSAAVFHVEHGDVTKVV